MGIVWLIKCFVCECLIPPRPDPVCTECLRKLEEWDTVDPP